VRFSPAALPAPALVALIALLAAGCGSAGPRATTTTTSAVSAVAPHPTCSYRRGWQLLADRMEADVYCPGWLPDPLTAQIGGQWNNINSVSPSSYLESFIWQDTDTPGVSGLLHIILRGYPRRTTIPTCMGGISGSTRLPCFASANGHVAANGIRATIYTVNQDADAWHIVLLWRHKGGLYTVSEHLAPPLDYRQVVGYLTHELSALVVIAPARST
jgi:hypothetical protein